MLQDKLRGGQGVGRREWTAYEATLQLSNRVSFRTNRHNLSFYALCVQANSNSSDGGVLQGRWSGNYDGGTNPTTWTGSIEILEMFWKTKKTVKYGQCWVFSGLVTTRT